MQIVRAAKAAGADAIKLQTYTPDTMTLNCDSDCFRIHEGSLWEGKTLYQLYAEAMTPWEWHRPLKEEAEKIGLHFFSTPFDETSVNFLEELGVPAYKIASFELTDDLLLRRVARTGKPVIMSTGMSTMEEIARALSVLRSSGAREIALLKCVSAYPAPLHEMNLSAITRLRESFGVVVGLSDHTLGDVSSLVSVGLGAAVFEKHLRLDDGESTPDAVFSMTPLQLEQLVVKMRDAEAAMGVGFIGRTDNERANLRFRRSIFVSCNIKQGAVFSRENIQLVRPGFGLPSYCWDKIIGQKAAHDLSQGQPLGRQDVVFPSETVRPEFQVRMVRPEDARVLWEWRNLRDVREVSIGQEEISWEQHVHWLDEKLKDPQTIFYMIEVAGQVAGQVRFAIKDFTAQVSIVLAPSYRACGLGSAALQQLSQALFLNKWADVVEALIRQENTASLSAFVKAGFIFETAITVSGVDCFLYKMKKTSSS